MRASFRCYAAHFFAASAWYALCVGATTTRMRHRNTANQPTNELMTTIACAYIDLLRNYANYDYNGAQATVEACNNSGQLQ